MHSNLGLASLPGHNRLCALTSDIAKKGWSVLDGWTHAGLIDDLAAAARAHDEQERTRIAAIGPTEKAVIDRSQRRARLRWLSEGDAAERAYLECAA